MNQMTLARAHFIERMTERFPWARTPNPVGPYRSYQFGNVPKHLGDGTWVYPFAWITPMHWYLSHLQFPQNTQNDDPGVTWLETVIDFEFSTGPTPGK